MKDTFLTVLRDKNTNIKDFRIAAHRISELLVGDTCKLLKMKKVQKESPLSAFEGTEVPENIILIPILRAGLAMLHPFLTFFPSALVGVVGYKRDEETAEAHKYYENIPEIPADASVIVLDPMLATGGTLQLTLEEIKAKGVAEKNIIYVGIIGAEEGVQRIKTQFPEVKIVLAQTDAELNDQKFIVPGLGDFGDRYWGSASA